MFKHLVIPLDGTSLAEAILGPATYLARALQARVTLLHTVEPEAPATIHGEPHLDGAEPARAYLDRVADQLRAAGLTVAVDVEAANPAGVAASILDKSGELNADMILLSAHGSHGLRGILFGRIAQQVVQAGEIPVLMLRPEEEATHAWRVARLLVPLDGRAIYEPSIRAAIELARATGGALHLLVVVPTATTLSPERAATGTLLPSSTRAVLDLAQRGAVQYLEQWMRQLKQEGVPAQAEVVRGETVPGILDAVKRTSADLLVMATHGRSGLDAFWSGSVAPEVLRQVTIPALLLRVTGEEPVR